MGERQVSRLLKGQPKAVAFVGQITLYAGTTPPTGWALCNGQELNISDYRELWLILGTTFGGDGVNTFAVPDLRSRVPVHPGSSPSVSLGDTGGSSTHTLNTAQLPVHNHDIKCNNTGSNSDDPQAHFMGQGLDVFNLTSNQNMAPTANTGSGTAFNIMQPYLGLNYIIATEGIL